MTFARLALLAVLAAAPVLAQAADPVVEAARAAGTAGEQADGYLGVRPGAAPEVKAHVDAINIQRRAIYTDTASQKPGVTVADVGAAAACQQFRNRVAVGHFYRDQTGTWRQHTAGAPVAIPSFCG